MEVKLADDTKLGGKATCDEDCNELEEELNRLTEWSGEWQMSASLLAKIKFAVERRIQTLSTTHTLRHLYRVVAGRHPLPAPPLASPRRWLVESAYPCLSATSPIGRRRGTEPSVTLRSLPVLCSRSPEAQAPPSRRKGLCLTKLKYLS